MAARLGQVWEQTRQTGPELLLLEGAAGLGKSFLVAALRQQVLQQPGARTVLVSGNVVGSVLRGLPEVTARRDAALMSAARSFLPDHSWPQVIASRVSSESPEVVIARAVSDTATHASPLLLLIEDIHDHCEQSRAFLMALWTRCLLDERPLLLVLTSRPLPEHPAAQTLQADLERTSQLIRGRPCLYETLQPVDERAVQRMVRVFLGEVYHESAAPDQLSLWLHEQAGGHPLRIAELLHLLREQGALSVQGHGWNFVAPPMTSLPGSLSAVILARLRPVQLHSGPWRLLTALAVLGGVAEESPWRQVAQLSRDVFASALNWLLHRDLIRPVAGGPVTRYQCGHPLYGPLLEAELDWSQLVALHGRAAGASLDILARARHARSAELPEARELTQAALLAAVERGAHPEVIREARELLGWEETSVVREALVAALRLTGELEQVLDETDPDLCPHPTPPLLAARAQALMDLARLPEAVKLARTALSGQPGRVNTDMVSPDAISPDAISPDTVEGMILENVLYSSLIDLGQLDEAEQIVQGALGTQPAPEGVRQMMMLHVRSRLSERRGDFHLSLHLAREAVVLAEQRGLEESRDPWYADQCWQARNWAGGCAIHLSLWAEAERHLSAAHALATRNAMLARLMIVEGNFAYIQLMRGEYPESEAGSWAQLRSAEASGNRRIQAGLLWNIGICRLWRGDAAKALDCMQQSEQLWHSLEGANASDFAEALAFQGRLTEARATLDQPDHDYYPEHPNSRARVYLLLGDPQAALYSVAGVNLTDGHGLYARTLLIRAQAQLCLGRRDAARELLAEAARHALLVQHRSVGAEVALTEAVLTLSTDGVGVGVGVGVDAAAQALWAEAVGDLLFTDGQGHTGFVQALFPEAAGRLSSLRAATQAPAVRSRLRLFGNLRVEQPGGARPWRARKVKELLALLLCAHYSEGGGGLPRESLILELWPDADGESAEYSFRKTVARLREALGDAATLGRDAQGHYALQDVHSDLGDFLRAQDRQLGAASVPLYTAPFLNDLDLAAIEPLRAALHSQWRRALLLLAETEPQSALPHLTRLVAEDFLDLEATLALLQIHENARDWEAHASFLKQARSVYSSTMGEVPAELQFSLPPD